VNAGCKGHCLRYFSKIIRKGNLIGLTPRQRWRYIKCSKCNLYWNFQCLKSHLCPCCHHVLSKIRFKSEKLYSDPFKKKRNEYNQKYYRTHPEKWVVYREKRKTKLKLQAEAQRNDSNSSSERELESPKLPRGNEVGSVGIPNSA